MASYRVEVTTERDQLVSEECGSLEYARKIAAEGLSLNGAQLACIHMRTPGTGWQQVECQSLDRPRWV